MRNSSKGGMNAPIESLMSADLTPSLLSSINAPSAKLYIRMLDLRFHSAIFFDDRITEKEDFEGANIVTD